MSNDYFSEDLCGHGVPGTIEFLLDYGRNEGGDMVKLSAGEKKKKLIVDTCKKLFYRQGYNNTTYEDICREADIPPGTITYHFNGKRDIAAVIDTEYEAQNKIYIEKVCGTAYTLTQMMVIENFHMWKRTFEDDRIRRFLLDISSERLPTQSSVNVVGYYYRCVLDDQGLSIPDKELPLVVASQIGMSDGILHAIAHADYQYSYEEVAHFAIRFFLRQCGLDDDSIERLTREGKEIFDTLPIDNRYYEDFAYDDRFVEASPSNE